MNLSNVLMYDVFVDICARKDVELYQSQIRNIESIRTFIGVQHSPLPLQSNDIDK